ncbi:MAG: amino-acid N-acetyltransferase [Betaproteobacteria bacterium]|nr:amino-acid N-acetyltransferase [Betaproteobacteria bacterium]
MNKRVSRREQLDATRFVQWFRSVAPYVNGFRGQTFVVAFGGEGVTDGRFVERVHDFSLLASLGIRLVLAHGARPQIEARLAEKGLETGFVQGKRITDAAALQCVKESVGRVRAEIEALLSMGLPNSPMANADIRVAGGNFVTAQPIGVLDGVDMLHTGEVRKIDAAAIRGRLDAGEVVLLSPLGYSPTGEIFNLSMEDVAASAAVALGASKLVFLMDSAGVPDKDGQLLRELTVDAAERAAAKPARLPADVQLYLPCAVRACRGGVARAHLVSRHVDGALLLELFTHDGIGTMIAQAPLEKLRTARIDDIGAILKIIEPLEAEGVLVRRGRELLEREIDRFVVLEHDRMLIGCAALYPFPGVKSGELACLAVLPDHRDRGCGELLVKQIESLARKRGLRRLFVLTTRAEHWFEELGFEESSAEMLPRQRRALYNLQRRSKVFVKRL